MGLEAINNTWKWSALSEADSAAALQNFSNWCMPQAFMTIMGVQIPTGYGRGGAAGIATTVATTVATTADAVAAAVAAAAASTIPMCSLLRYDKDRCSGGWGWDPSPCSDHKSYLCQLSAQGVFLL